MSKTFVVSKVTSSRIRAYKKHQSMTNQITILTSLVIVNDKDTAAWKYEEEGVEVIGVGPQEPIHGKLEDWSANRCDTLSYQHRYLRLQEQEEAKKISESRPREEQDCFTSRLGTGAPLLPSSPPTTRTDPT